MKPSLIEILYVMYKGSLSATILKKLRYGKKWYTQTDGNKVIIPLLNIFHQKLKTFVPYCINNFPGNLYPKYQSSSLVMKVLLQIYQYSHYDISVETFIQDKI